MESLFDALCVGSERVSNSIVYAQNKIIGILCPSVVEGMDSSGSAYIGGPAGVVRIFGSPEPGKILEALVTTKSILFGTEAQVIEVQALLSDCKTSRTASYLCCIARNCQELIHAFKRIQRGRVLVVGCGGIGSLVAMQLAGAGIENLVLIDPDVIEASNLNRQFLWGRSDVGRAKVDVLKEALECRYILRSCQPLKQQVNDTHLEELTIGADVVVLSADEPLGWGQEKLKELASEKGFLTVSCGYYQNRALVRAHGKTPTKACEDTIAINWSRSPNFIGPSFGPMNVEVAGVVASSVIHALAFPESTAWHKGGNGLNLSWVPFERSNTFLH